MILGDSLAEGLTNNLSARPGLNIIGGSIRGSGLGSSDIDWLQETKAQLANNFPDAVLISIGTNDTRAAANDFEWYARRTEAMMTLLDKLPTVWFLPPDTATNYLPGLDAIIRLQVETARHHRRNLILIHWPAGYSSRDGIHQSSAGYARAADEALKALRLASPRLSTRRI
jgi:lysophospholipase L1-like esterase